MSLARHPIAALIILMVIATSAFAQQTHRPRTLPIDGDEVGFSLWASWGTTEMHYRINRNSFERCSAFEGLALNIDRVIAEVQQALLNWPQQSAAPIHPVYDGDTSAEGLQFDGSSTVSCSTESSPNGFIGQTTSWLDAQGHVIESDIVFWQGTYPQYPFVTRDVPCGSCLYYLDTGTHEAGHFFGLLHSTETLATMYPSTYPGSINEETLYTDDIQGIETLYPVTSTVPPPTTDPPPPVTSCVMDGVTYALGATQTRSMKNGQVGPWLTLQEAAGWTLLSTVKSKGTSTVTVQCGGS